jgi:hypothetical protein
VEEVNFKFKPRIRKSKRLEGLSSSLGRLSDEDAEPATDGSHEAFVSNSALSSMIPIRKLAIRHLISTLVLETVIPSPTTVVDDEWLFPLGITINFFRQQPSAIRNTYWQEVIFKECYGLLQNGEVRQAK